VVIRKAGVPVHVLIFYAAIISILFQGVIFAFSQKLRSRIPRGREAVKLLSLGPVTLMNTFFFFFAYQSTSISNAVMTHYIAPIVVAFLAFFLLKEPLTKKIIFSLILSSVGLYILLGVQPQELLGLLAEPDDDMLGILAGLASGLAYAVLVILTRVLAPKNNPFVMTFFQNIMIVILLLPFIGGLYLHALWSYVVVGILYSTIAPMMYFRGLKDVRANKAAILGYMEPVGAILFAMLLLSEYPAVASLAGGALILLAGYVVLTDNANA
jgi:drug/metabolite transporter (DMT)-like permease